VSDTIIQNVSITGEGNIVVGKGDVIINPLPPAEARLRHDLGILLKNVETTWIKGVLEQSMNQAALLDLGLELREDAVDHPMRSIIEDPYPSPEPLPRIRKIKDIFEAANRRLLILGEPGSGKTTTLLQLARALIGEVDKEFTQPVPVILNLTTWTNKQQALNDWLVAELSSRYRVPKRDGQKWLKERRILPLLDGLDEVQAENRAVCVQKINQLVKEYGLQGIVVCSRIKNYVTLNVRLEFDRAIYIQPLTNGQVDEFLSRAGEKLASLRATLQGDNDLQSMARSPLILNIMSLAYQNVSAETLSNPALNTTAARRRHLFDTYIARMFNRKAGRQQYEAGQTKKRLSWLAMNMQAQNQDVFQIEGLQPSWLMTRRWQWTYFFISRLATTLTIGLLCWLFARTFFVMIFALSTGLSAGVIDVLRSEWQRRPRDKKKAPTFFWSVFNIITIWFIAGMVVLIFILWVDSFWSLEEHQMEMMLDFDYPMSMMFGWILLIFAGLFFGVRGTRYIRENDIQTVEALRWSWPSAIRGGLTCGVIAMVVIISIFLVIMLIYLILIGPGLFSFFDESFGRSLLNGVVYYVLIGAIFNGLRPVIVETKSMPNQGILLSLRNAVIGVAAVGPISWLISRMGLPEYAIGYEDGPLFFGIALGLCGFFWFGGIDIIQHYILRLILIIQNHAPGRYAHFLDYAVDRIFLQKVGGGYRFIHRLLREHFAEMDHSTPEKVVSPKVVSPIETS